MTVTNPQHQRAIEKLDQVERVLPGLMYTLNGLVAEAHRIAGEMGLTVEDWRALSIEEREEVLRQYGQRGCRGNRRAS